MTDTALFGLDDEPAHLDGYGPIPAELAREIVVDACAPRRARSGSAGSTPARRPVELVASDARGRLFPRRLSRFVRLRDRTCRTPWCDAPIRHTDHATGHQAGGPTSLTNAQGLCEACNHAKQATGWRPARRAAPPHPAPPHRHRDHHPDRAHLRHATSRTGDDQAHPGAIDYVLAG